MLLSEYHLDIKKDAERDAMLAEHGWTIFRITGADCFKEFDEESMELSPGALFIKAICDKHGLSRNTLPKGQGFVSIQNVLARRALGIES